MSELKDEELKKVAGGTYSGVDFPGCYRLYYQLQELLNTHEEYRTISNYQHCMIYVDFGFEALMDFRYLSALSDARNALAILEFIVKNNEIKEKFINEAKSLAEELVSLLAVAEE